MTLLAVWYLTVGAQTTAPHFAALAASLALMSLPLGIRRTKPELLTVLPDPPRYQVRLARVTPNELKSALSALAPPALLIEPLA